jgi:hypothetical protein
VAGGYLFKLVACLFAMAALGSNRYLSKIKNGRHKQSSGKRTLARQKKNTKNNNNA